MVSVMRARAVVVREGGALSIEERDVAAPGPGELLLDVAACGLNRADCLQRRGRYPAPPDEPQDVLGLELAGRVAELGPGVRSWRVGDAAMGIVGGGGMVTRRVVRADGLLRVPDGMELSDAAAIPEAFLTAWDALFAQGALATGEVALIHGVASGVGTAAVQLARAAGATTVGTTRSEDKLARCRELGLEHGIVVRDGCFADELARWLGGARGANVILDVVGAAYLAENLRALAHRGRWVMIGLLGGAKGELALAPLLQKRARLCASTLRARSAEEKAALAAAFAADALARFDSGELRPVVDAVVSPDGVEDAYARMEANGTTGKLVLAW